MPGVSSSGAGGFSLPCGLGRASFTPKTLRIRKRILDHSLRMKAAHPKK